MSKSKKLGLVTGPAAFALLLVLAGTASLPEGLSPAAIRMAAVAVLMAVWWITEAIPIPVTSLLPIALFPALGIMKSGDATRPYGHHLIYLFLGGFLLAKAIERWGLHRRIALHIIALMGTSPRRIVLGFMTATAFLSMWVSNTATAMMMLPVGLAVIAEVEEAQGRAAGEGSEHAPPAPNSSFSISLMLGIAYAASIGGVATLIGTPPNGVLAAVAEQQYGQSIGFARWMAFATPLSIVFLAVTWLLLTRLLHPPEVETIPGGRALIDHELERIGPISRAEKRVLTVFVAVAVSWVARGFLKTSLVDDTTIAIAGGIALFLVPSGSKQGLFLLDWKTAVTIPWGVLVLFGGGLALAKGIDAVGLAHWFGTHLASIDTRQMVILMTIVVIATIFLTELTSNTATAALLVPLMGTSAVAMAVNPLGLMIGTCVAASYAFMLPVATPPNAVVFGSGRLTIGNMARAGIWLNLVGSVLILLFTLFWLPLVWGIDLGTLPAWAAPAHP